jgi:DNA-3-methyladenine glycosylase II
MQHLHQKALQHLKQDPVMASLIERYPEPIWVSKPVLYDQLIESVIGQQLSEKAGDTISRRFKELFNLTTIAAPELILGMEDAVLRSSGISYSKIKYIKGIAEAMQAGQLDYNRLLTLSDEEVITELTKLKGVGRWTAEMTLIFTLQRPDVFSMGDVGLRNAVARLYHVDRDDLKAIASIADKWHPYRSIACRYLWKSLENQPVTLP